MHKIIKLIDKNVCLNLGIKTFIRLLIRNIKTLYLNGKKNIFILKEKIFSKLFKYLSEYFYNRIFDHYGADYKWGDEPSQNLDSKTNNYGYGSLHYSLVRNQKPKKILCIGSMYGYIPYMLAKACEDNKLGHVYFVDASYNIDEPKDQDKHFFGQGFWNKKDAKSHFKFMINNPKKYISLHVRTSENFIKKNKKIKFDYIYLDGDHSYKGVKADIKRLWPKLNKGGYLCLHDISYDKKNSVIQIDMKQIWSEINSQQKNNQILEFTNNYSGIGLIKKLNNKPLL